MKLKGINFLQVPGGLVPYGELLAKFRSEQEDIQVAMTTNVCTHSLLNLEEPGIPNF